MRFATTPERRTILEGLLDYRHALNAIGFNDGYQWLDGSFVEDVETLEGRPPNDIDVLTVVRRPIGVNDFATLVATNINLFDPGLTKRVYRTDGYIVDLEKPPHLLVNDIVYWYGLFSHKRKTSLWKGMLSVPFDVADDVFARVLL
ncbi:hypothetical protein GCM10011335_23740 [Aureimonas glaciei]|uniref:Uncharacterized protein n=2 Tax=Aureimonas glaciei TaxID=1776957 RepID=A0A917DAV7_9HYPH|nr:hypothetical protein GCM10011335_23740 [Aureimonas glaciei]